MRTALRLPLNPRASSSAGIGMSEYYPAFLRQGYDDIDFLFAAGELQSRAQIVTTTSEKE